MFAHRVLNAPIGQDLADFSQMLWQQGLAHRITEEGGEQVLWVANEAHVEVVKQVYREFSQGKLRIERVPLNPASGSQKVSPRTAVYTEKGAGYFELQKIALTVALIVLSIIGGLIVAYSGPTGLMKWLTFQDYALNRSSLGFFSPQYALEKGQIWRLLTPAFLHFGILHTVFNSLWIWELGRRIEIGLGFWRLAGLVVLIGVGANIGQYLIAPNQLFGGMSGVIYGLLGYCWIYNRLSPHAILALPTSMVGFMVFWLLICMTDFMSAFGVAVANAAHVSGLILGLVLGLGHAFIQRNSNRP